MLELNKEELVSILESLNATKSKIENLGIGPGDMYPDYNTKRESLDRIESLIEKVRQIKNSL